MTGYTVIDFETTGFCPQMHDRVIEIGVVYVSPTGEIEDSWGTLINPERDMGATRIHGIRGSDVLDAPTFDQVAPYLLRAIAGRTVVAHNARFDLSFLEHEFQRAGVTLNSGTPCVCTMEWSRAFINGASRKLADCCVAAGVAHETAHTAVADALATAGLLAYYLKAAGIPPPWAGIVQQASIHGWPTFSGEYPAISMLQRPTGAERPEAWLDKITSNMPRIDNPAVESYVDVLERALLDGYLSEHEKRELVEVAVALGLQRDQLEKIHLVYLSALAAAAWADGVVTADERAQLAQVAEALGISSETSEQILKDAAGSTAPFDLPALRFMAGDRVVFTGELRVPRDVWIERVAALGIKHGSVTKGTRAVVAADPDSLSGKAAKARDYGIPIIAESAFEKIVSTMESRQDARSQALKE